MESRVVTSVNLLPLLRFDKRELKAVVVLREAQTTLEMSYTKYTEGEMPWHVSTGGECSGYDDIAQSNPELSSSPLVLSSKATPLHKYMWKYYYFVDFAWSLFCKIIPISLAQAA